MYVRIKTPKKLNTNVPSSIKAGGKKIVQGGPGTEIKDTKVLSRIKKIGGENIETSKKPFDEIKPSGGVIDTDAMKMRKRQEVDDDGDDETADGKDSGK